MSTQKNLITLCFATVFTLGLAACGGGGGGDAPVTGMMDGDGSLEGKYILSGTIIPVEDVPDGTMIPIDGGAMLVLAGLGTVQCVSDDGCLGTVADGVLTVEGDLKIVSVDANLDTETATALAGLTVDMLPDEATEPEPTPAEQLAAANTLVATAQGLVGALTSSSTPEEASAAYAALGAAQAALHAATNLPANQIAAIQSQVDQLTIDLNAANAVAMQAAAVKAALATATAAVDGLTDASAEADVTAARSAVAAAQAALAAATDVPMEVSDNLGALISSLDTRLSATESVVADRPTAQEIAKAAAATAAAGTKVTAIDDEAKQTDDAGLGGSDVDSVTMTVARDRDGTKITITDTANPADADPANPQFAQAMDLGGGRTMHVRAMDANDEGEVVEEVVIVKTDIAAPKKTPFAMVRNPDGELTQELLVNPKTTDGDDFQSIDVLTANSAQVMSASFSASSMGTLDFAMAVAATETVPAVAAFETAGTYNGAPGMYKCIATNDDCSVMLDAKGVIIGVSTGWIFTPATGATSDVADAEYLHYGFWLMRTTKDGATTYDEVETFAEAMGFDETEETSTTLGAVTGDATYEGGSVGVYVKNVLDDQANGHL